MRTVVAVPVKDLVNAKQRLTAVLSAAERAELARAMLEDVLATLCAAPLDAVHVVTRDPEVIAHVRRAGVATVLTEESNRGHSQAVLRAQTEAARAGVDAFLTIPGDVPCVTPGEVEALLGAAAAAERCAVFVPSASGDGTNAALLRPPLLMTLKFGEPSFANHLVAARRHEVEPVVLRLPGLALDIDGPEDLRALLDREGATRSRALLVAIGARERLGS